MNALSSLAGVYHVPLSYLLKGEEECTALLTEHEIQQLMHLKGKDPALFNRFCSLADSEDELISSLGCLLGRIV